MSAWLPRHRREPLSPAEISLRIEASVEAASAERRARDAAAANGLLHQDEAEHGAPAHDQAKGAEEEGPARRLGDDLGPALQSEGAIPPDAADPRPSPGRDEDAPRPNPLPERAETVARPRHRGVVVDRPVVTIEVSGAGGSGKSVIAHLIRTSLAFEGIAAVGPDGLMPIHWRGDTGALAHLRKRGIAVNIVERET